MEGTARIWFTPQQRAELWERWKNGQCVADIARALERRNKSGVYRILALNGGIAPELRRRAAVSPSLPTCRSISAIHTTLGSAAATRTPMVCCDSISRAEQISHASRKTT